MVSMMLGTLLESAQIGISSLMEHFWMRKFASGWPDPSHLLHSLSSLIVSASIEFLVQPCFKRDDPITYPQMEEIIIRILKNEI